jgi:hypothetical protein
MVAGALFGIAVEIKLISLVMLPIATLLISLNQRQTPSPGRNITKSLLVLSACLVISSFAADLLASHGAYLAHFQESWVSHFGGTKSHEHGSPDEHRFDWIALMRNWDLTVPAALGVVICVRRLPRSISAVLPLIWLAYSLLVFGLHHPWWNYYYVHTAIPLCWCAAIGIEAVWANLRWPQARLCFAVFALYATCVGIWLTVRLSLEIKSVRHSPQTYACLFLHEMERYKPQARWLYTEEQACVSLRRVAYRLDFQRETHR